MTYSRGVDTQRAARQRVARDRHGRGMRGPISGSQQRTRAAEFVATTTTLWAQLQAVEPRLRSTRLMISEAPDPEQGWVSWSIRKRGIGRPSAITIYRLPMTWPLTGPPANRRTIAEVLSVAAAALG